MTVELFPVVCVRDHDAAIPWYTKLFGGPPTFEAHETESVWTLAEGRHVAVHRDPDHAGHTRITLFHADDLEATVAAIAGRGLEPHAEERYGNGVRKVTFRDADGNEIGLGGPPQ